MTPTTSSIREPWIVRPQPRADAALRLFCFPYAGVGVSVYRAWPANLPTTDVVMMQPPGREGRWSERPFTRLEDMVAAATEAIRPHLTGRYAFYGHSLGALVSFEVARSLRREGAAGPVHLFASAHRSPQLPNPHPEMRTLPDAGFIEQICQRYGGIPQAVLDNPDLVELMLPCLRADFTVFETYTYADPTPLDCPITAFGGRSDRRVSEGEVAAWRAQTTAAFRYEMFDGDHFFLQNRRDLLLASIMRDLNGVMVEAGAR
jgi:medium-chain acyl-[acyl-carrier-protein] hydrolase